MKTYEEMARSVMVRAKAYKRRKCWIMSTSVACICCIILGIVFWGGPQDDQPVTQLQKNPITVPTTSANNVPVVESPPTDTGNSRITFLSATGNETVSMRENVTLPLQMEMRVKNLQGMIEEEKEAVIEAEAQYAKDIVNSVGSVDKWGYYQGPGYSWSQYKSENHVLTTIIAGHFYLAVDEPDEMESVYFETGGPIQLAYLPEMEEDTDVEDEWRYLLDETEIKRYYNADDGGFVFTWHANGLKIGEMERNDAYALSEFSDYIKIVVTFKDGTVEEHRIDIIITDDGKTSAIYRGQKETL